MAGPFLCHACAAEIELEDPIGRSQHCPRCGSELRCCLNCRFYDTSAYNECSEPMAERVLEKSRANFCDYFSAARKNPAKPAADPPQSDPPQRDRLADLETLFRKH